MHFQNNRTTWLNRAAPALAALAVLSAAGASLAVPTQVVALRGDPTPDGDGTLFGLSVVPTLNQAGQAAFAASTSGGTSPGGVFRGSGGTLAQIARAGHPAPGGDGELGTFFLGVSINNAGQAGFTANIVETPSGSDRGLFRGDGNSLVSIARVNQPVPGGNGTILSLPFEHTMNDAGQVAFFALLGGTSGGTTDNRALYRGNGGSLTQIARKGQAVVGTGGGAIEEFTSFPSMNQAGLVSFGADLLNTTGGTSDNAGIFRSDGSTMTQVARKGQLAPGGNGNFSSFFSPVINDSGHVAFRAFLSGTSGGTSDDLAIYRGDGSGAITQVAREGQAVPGGNGALSFMFIPAFNEAGHTAFTAAMSGTSGGTSDDTALYRGDPSGGALVQVAREGQPVPGGNGVFGQLDSFADTDFALSDGGHVAFIANLTGTSGGGSDDGAIYLLDDAMGLVEVAREGDAMLGSSVINLRLAPGTFGEEVGGINITPQVAYHFSLADGREGIAIATVPEPAIPSMVGIGAILLLRRRQ